MSTKRDPATSLKIRTSSSLSVVSAASAALSQPLTIFPMHVLGGGSIGLLYASGMHRAYNEAPTNTNTVNNEHESSDPVTLLLRSHHKPCLRERFGSTVDKTSPHLFAPVAVSKPSIRNGNKSVVKKCDIPVDLINETNLSKDDTSPIKCLLLCTKATDAIPALTSVWDRLSSSSYPSPSNVIILSNGALAIRDAVHKHFSTGKHNNEMTRQIKLDGGVQIDLATTTHGAYRTQSTNSENKIVGHYNVTHAGEGSTHSTNKEFIDTCQSIGWNSAVLSDLDMNVMLWKKLAVNCVINPLTAIHGVKNGQLLQDFQHMGQDIHGITRQVLEEVSLVAMLEMESLFEEAMSKNGEHDKVGDVWLQSTREELAVPALEAFVFKVMADTANNISSMLQDVKAERTTEVRYLNGYVASLGREKYGMKCQSNIKMCQLVEDLMP